jgi:hypothetical protein
LIPTPKTADHTDAAVRESDLEVEELLREMLPARRIHGFAR